MKGFFITGTDTGVGKTEVADCLARHFSRKGFKVAVMKPVATGVNAVSKDAQLLKRSSLSNAPMHYINPVSLKLPLAPLVASRIEKKKIDLKLIWDRFEKLKKANDIILVEGIGGVMVPICEKDNGIFYVLDMIEKMKLPVIIVSRPNLGTINHTLMTVNRLKTKGIKIAGIIFSYSSPIKKDISVKTNPKIIEELSGVDVLGIMYYNKDKKKRKIISDYTDFESRLHRLETENLSV